jgi:hypothetical protein
MTIVCSNAWIGLPHGSCPSFHYIHGLFKLFICPIASRACNRRSLCALLVSCIVVGARGGGTFLLSMLIWSMYNSAYEAHWTSCCTNSSKPSFQKMEPTHLGPTKGILLSFSKSYKKYTKLVRLGNVWITCSFVTHVVSIKWKKLQSPLIQILNYCCCVGNGCESQATRGWSIVKSMTTE